MRQWVLNVPFRLRFLFASNHNAMTGALGIVNRAISTLLAHKAGITKTVAQTGAGWIFTTCGRLHQDQ
jgi:hypothetical protein